MPVFMILPSHDFANPYLFREILSTEFIRVCGRYSTKISSASSRIGPNFPGKELLMRCKTSSVVGWVLAVTLLVSGAESRRILAAEPDALRPPAISVESVPVVPGELMERLAQYQNTRAAIFRGWSPDGRGILIATRFGDTAQLHRVYEASGRREQVTFFREPCHGVFLPAAKDGALLLTMNQGGSENDQVYFLDRQTGRTSLLTDGKSRNLLGPVREDGSRVVISNNSRNGRDTDLYLAEPRRAGSMTLLMQVANEFWTATDWSPDGSKLLLNRYVSINESYPALLDVGSGEKSLLPIPGGDKASFQNLKCAPDGKSAYVTTDARGEFQQLARLNLRSMQYEWLTSDIPWDVESIEVSAFGASGFHHQRRWREFAVSARPPSGQQAEEVRSAARRDRESGVLTQ